MQSTLSIREIFCHPYILDLRVCYRFKLLSNLVREYTPLGLVAGTEIDGCGDRVTALFKFSAAGINVFRDLRPARSAMLRNTVSTTGRQLISNWQLVSAVVTQCSSSFIRAPSQRTATTLSAGFPKVTQRVTSRILRPLHPKLTVRSASYRRSMAVFIP